MKRKSISDRRSVENNSDKRIQKLVLFNQHRPMRQPQTYFLIVQVHFRLICVNMRQFSKIATDDRKYTFAANSYTAALEKAFKIDANGARAFMGHFLCGVETIKRFVKIRLHCNVSKMKKISKMSTLHSPWKNFCGRSWLLSPFQQVLTYGQVGLS